jgi:hypothetical protein
MGVGGVALLGVAAYVAYKRARGEDLTPDGAKKAQDAYKKFHADRDMVGSKKKKKHMPENQKKKQDEE